MKQFSQEFPNKVVLPKGFCSPSTGNTPTAFGEVIGAIRWGAEDLPAPKRILNSIEPIKTYG